MVVKYKRQSIIKPLSLNPYGDEKKNIKFYDILRRIVLLFFYNVSLKILSTIILLFFFLIFQKFNEEKVQLSIVFIIHIHITFVILLNKTIQIDIIERNRQTDRQT